MGDNYTNMIKNRNIAADAAIQASKLLSVPSNFIKFVKLGSEITTTALSGLAVGDLVIRFIVANSTVTAKLCATADTLPDDPADGDYIVVLRAAL